MKAETQLQLMQRLVRYANRREARSIAMDLVRWGIPRPSRTLLAVEQSAASLGRTIKAMPGTIMIRPGLSPQLVDKLWRIHVFMIHELADHEVSAVRRALGSYHHRMLLRYLATLPEAPEYLRRLAFIRRGFREEVARMLSPGFRSPEDLLARRECADALIAHARNQRGSDFHRTIAFSAQLLRRGVSRGELRRL
ncbi:MAG TPA: hypothetical protein VFL98_02045 [Candidatus Paceibacterota bacterium]|nr:hypothetical protein [Candidatus Paceibacterota bacterium]